MKTTKLIISLSLLMASATAFAADSCYEVGVEQTNKLVAAIGHEPNDREGVENAMMQQCIEGMSAYNSDVMFEMKKAAFEAADHRAPDERHRIINGIQADSFAAGYELAGKSH